MEGGLLVQFLGLRFSVGPPGKFFYRCPWQLYAGLGDFYFLTFLFLFLEAMKTKLQIQNAKILVCIRQNFLKNL